MNADATSSGLTFVVADLHGRLDLLELALDAIAAYPGVDASRTVVFLGDYVDRGPHGAQVIARLRNGPPLGSDWVCLKGNHEAMMGLALRHPERLDWWIGNGGDATIASYASHRDQVAGDLAWIDGLPLVHVDDRRVYVHAGVEPRLPLEAQQDKTLLWKRYADGDESGFGERHVVHGHTPHEDGPQRFAGRTNLDTLAWWTGRLVIGVFDDGRAGGPADLIELRGRPA